MDFSENNIGQFLDELSSKAPVPGGGGVSALTGALAAGLSQMVCSLTIGKKKYADVEIEIEAAAHELLLLRDKLVSCMAEDALAFEPLSRAYGLPKNTDEEISVRKKVLADCLIAAALPPLHICSLIDKMVPYIETVAEKGSTLAISDAGCSAALAKSAIRAAALNVFVNTRLMEDRKKAEELNIEVLSALDSAEPRLDAIYENVFKKLEN